MSVIVVLVVYNIYMSFCVVCVGLMNNMYVHGVVAIAVAVFFSD